MLVARVALPCAYVSFQDLLSSPSSPAPMPLQIRQHLLPDLPWHASQTSQLSTRATPAFDPLAPFQPISKLGGRSRRYRFLTRGEPYLEQFFRSFKWSRRVCQFCVGWQDDLSWDRHGVSRCRGSVCCTQRHHGCIMAAKKSRPREAARGQIRYKSRDNLTEPDRDKADRMTSTMNSI